MGRERNLKAARRAAKRAGITPAVVTSSPAPTPRVPISPVARASGPDFLAFLAERERRRMRLAAVKTPVRVPLRVRLRNWWNRVLVRLHLRRSWTWASRE
jgi:hypothetical protein